MAVYKTLDDILNTDSRFDVNKITFLTTTEDGTLVIPDVSLFRIYQRYVQRYVREVMVTRAQQEFYRFRPYILSLDIYGTSDLAWLILDLNGKECASKFYLKKTMRLIPPSQLTDVYSMLLTKSSERLTKNLAEYTKLIGTEV